MYGPSLSALMDAVDKRYPTTTTEYPSLGKLSADERLSFVANHSLLHMCKVVGSISSECEAYGHGENLNTRVLQRAAAKMLINSLKLASDLDMTGEQLAEELSELMSVTATV